MTQPGRSRSVHRNEVNIKAKAYLHIPSAHFPCRLQEENPADPQTTPADEKDSSAKPPPSYVALPKRLP